MPFAKKIQRAEQAARQQEQREREALAQKKARGRKTKPQNLINQPIKSAS